MASFRDDEVEGKSSMVRVMPGSILVVTAVMLCGCAKGDYPAPHTIAVGGDGTDDHLARAKAAADQEKWDEALAQVAEVLDKTPQDTAALYLRSVVNRKKTRALYEDEGA